MIKSAQLIFLVIFVSVCTYAREPLDSIFISTDVMLINVKEVTEESLKFSYPGEDILNTVSTSAISNFQSFKSITETMNEFRYVEKHTLGINDDDMKITSQDGQIVQLSNAEKNGHLIYVSADIPGIDETKLRVSYFDNDQIILVYRTKKQIVNLILMQ